MKLVSLLVGVLPLTTLTAAVPPPPDKAEKDASKRIDKLQKNYQKVITDKIKHRTTGCKPSNILRRKEWYVAPNTPTPPKLTRRRGRMPKPERTAYIAALHCLANQTATTPPTLVPGVRNRHDDFVASLAFQADYILANGRFLPWHRLYLHLYEQALRTTCGYPHALPYWDWTLSYTDPRLAPIFDGSPYSLGSNGAYIPNRSPIVIQIPNGPTLVHNPGTGGGCISGPFSPATGWSANFGPRGVPVRGPGDGWGYNPRCITRDLSLQYASDMRPTNVTKLVDGCGDNFACFVAQLDVLGGLHSSGHFMVGGTQHDIFTGAADPAFWLHVAQVDRLWAVWQAQDLGGRGLAVAGTVTSGDCECEFLCDGVG